MSFASKAKLCTTFFVFIFMRWCFSSSIHFLHWISSVFLFVLFGCVFVLYFDLKEQNRWCLNLPGSQILSVNFDMKTSNAAYQSINNEAFIFQFLILYSYSFLCVFFSPLLLTVMLWPFQKDHLVKEWGRFGWKIWIAEEMKVLSESVSTHGGAHNAIIGKMLEFVVVSIFQINTSSIRVIDLANSWNYWKKKWLAVFLQSHRILSSIPTEVSSVFRPLGNF